MNLDEMIRYHLLVFICGHYSLTQFLHTTKFSRIGLISTCDPMALLVLFVALSSWTSSKSAVFMFVKLCMRVCIYAH